jgi:hypothetical protein
MRGLFATRTRVLPTAAKATALLLAAGVAALALPGDAAAQTRERERDRTSTSTDAATRAVKETVIAYIRTGDAETDRVSHAALRGLGRILQRRTTVEPAEPVGVDPENDELAFYPVIYWPVTGTQASPSRKAAEKLQAYLRNGGMIVFDIRNAAGMQDTTALRRLADGLAIPALMRMPEDHVLTRAYYLLPRFTGRFGVQPVWVARPDQAAKDGVSPVIIGSSDWGGAWAVDERGRPMFPMSAGEQERERAYRGGVNIVMYALAGNYKADQVHVPTILKRLGQ